MTDRKEKLPNQTDEELMARYANGDSNAFDELFKRYEGKIYGFLRLKVKDATKQKDVFQDTFLRLHKYRSRYSPKLAFKPWLFTLCYSSVIDAARRDSRSNEVFEEEQTIAVDSSMTASENLVQLNEIMRRLPAREQRALSLRFIQGFSFEEIAAKLTTTSVNVRKITSRAIGQLRILWKNEV